MVDVTVTAQGSTLTAQAVHQAGGLVGTRSSSNRPDVDVPIEFVDWPFMVEDPSVDRHLEVVRQEQPKLAVAPDVDAGVHFGLDEALSVARELEPHAEHVIVVPKTVHPDAIPDRYRVGAPFRDGFDTNTGVNTYFDFQDRPVHILGGNATDHFALADRFELDVESVDTPSPLPWADGGRVWVGRRRGADDVDDLVDEGVLDVGALQAFGLETPLELRASRAARISFTVRNLLAAWNEPGRAVELPAQIEPGRGPPPPAPEGLEEPAVREERLEAFERGVEDREVGRVEREAPAESAPSSLERFGETATEGAEEGVGMPDDEAERKRQRWQVLQEGANEEIEELGLGPETLPRRDEE